tara:strand:+ start:436 stop:1233 length:798 start_codon:yes stop_codon:yes gene_type:complete
MGLFHVRRWGVVLSLVVLCVFLQHFGFLRGVESLVRKALNPISSYVYTRTVQDRILGPFHSVADLENAYLELYEACILPEDFLLKNTLLEEENALLRQQLDFFSDSLYTHTAASVIGKNIDQLSSSIVINKGEDFGIQKENPVIAGNGTLVGIVIDVHEHSSVVRLINDNQSHVAVTIRNKDKSVGLIEGGYGISIRMSFVPQNELLRVGDQIVTSGLSENMPYGLYVGVVEAVEKQAYQPFQDAIIRSAVELDKLRIVSVIQSQ